MKDPEKFAKELVESFMNVKSHKMSDDSRIEWPTAKACALIAVERMKQQLVFTDLRTYVGRWCELERIFLYEVTKEIEKL